jgi:hypothetical protein
LLHVWRAAFRQCVINDNYSWRSTTIKNEGQKFVN